MQTPFDWLAVLLFAGVVYLLFRRLTRGNLSDRGLVLHIAPALGCALGNHFGNEGQPLLGLVIFGGTFAYIWFVLKPLGGDDEDEEDRS